MERFCIKLHAVDPAALDLAEAIPAFHRWIRSGAVPGLLIDVADYRHVPDGPAVALIGHEADYILDGAEGPLGLLYSRKRRGAGTTAERLAAGLHATLLACRALEREPDGARRGLRFDGRRVRLVFNDRLRAPNDDATLDALRPAVDAVLARLWPGREPAIERAHGDPRERLTLVADSGEEVDVATLLARIGV
jgi:hypothetical protein